MENINLNNIKGKRVLIVGMGKSGIAAIQAMLKLGAEVTVQDSKNAEDMDGQLLNFLAGRGLSLCLGKTPEDMGAFDMLILSPGVDPEMDFIEEAKSKGAEIVGELEIAYRVARGSFVAITGTNGKTTTTTLVGEIFKNEMCIRDSHRLRPEYFSDAYTAFDCGLRYRQRRNPVTAKVCKISYRFRR